MKLQYLRESTCRYVLDLILLQISAKRKRGWGSNGIAHALSKKFVSEQVSHLHSSNSWPGAIDGCRNGLQTSARTVDGFFLQVTVAIFRTDTRSCSCCEEYCCQNSERCHKLPVLLHDPLYATINLCHVETCVYASMRYSARSVQRSLYSPAHAQTYPGGVTVSHCQR